MTTSQNGSNGQGKTATWTVKSGLAQMLKGGVIMDVVTAEHAKVAEDAGAVAVMALERVPADIRAAGGVARMADPIRIQEIMDAVTVPVMVAASAADAARPNKPTDNPRMAKEAFDRMARPRVVATGCDPSLLWRSRLGPLHVSPRGPR